MKFLLIIYFVGTSNSQIAMKEFDNFNQCETAKEEIYKIIPKSRIRGASCIPLKQSK